jgi:hypothetical protein
MKFPLNSKELPLFKRKMTILINITLTAERMLTSSLAVIYLFYFLSWKTGGMVASFRGKKGKVNRVLYDRFCLNDDPTGPG